ncbi:unnamed protein product [Brachionus calyciflorus]|uniref:Uncharacterized protein n=1 Tax=Brachionus calyciflorus TaxID=104777 RepID=A0A813UXD9_9BILA|nr:unnamed protein product [Brachionus calyciflorus]
MEWLEKRFGYRSFFLNYQKLLDKEEPKIDGSGYLPETTVPNDNNRFNTHNSTSQNVAPSRIQRNKNNKSKFIKKNLRSKMNQHTQNSQNTTLFNNNSILNTNRQTIKNRMGYGPVQNRIFANSNKSNSVFSNKPSLSSNRGPKQQQNHQQQHHNNSHINQKIRRNQQQNFRWQPRSPTRI